MQALLRQEIQEAFDKDGELYIPPLDAVPWDTLDYFGWVHPAGHLGYLVLLSPNDGQWKGVRLNRSPRRSSRPRLEMCTWCHHVHRTNGTAMFTVSVKGSDGRHTLGNILCKDLDCSLRIRDMAQPDSYMKETLYQPAKVWRLQQTMHRWLGRANCL